MSNYKINLDVIVHFKASGWLVSNPRMRTHVFLSELGLRKLMDLGQTSFQEDSFVESFKDCYGVDGTHRYVGHKGLVNDHSCFKELDSSKTVVGKDLFKLLLSRNLIHLDTETGLELEQPMSNIFDQSNLGSFHQRVGQFTLMEKRSKEPWREWQNQKYSEDGKSLLNTSYKFIQEAFFDSYYTKDLVGGKNILDFGSGNCFYTAKLANRGANVWGLDNSDELLELAQENYGHLNNLKIHKTESFEAVANFLSDFEEGFFDYILLQDTLLLLIKPENLDDAPDLALLLKSFNRVLNKKGKLQAMEPNPQFWLSSRYGNPDKPYSVVTEYYNPVFNVAPTIDILIKAMNNGGFNLSDLTHPRCTNENDLQYPFQKEFPIWDFYTFDKKEI